jgi:signal transduction histidine kinase
LTERILYMEDDAAQARLVQKCLERAGYVVELAADGAAGLALFAVNAYAAVIVDQTMPGLSGLEVIRAMRDQGPLPPTVMVTGTGDEQIAVEAMKLGVSEYLVKDLGGGFVNVLPLVVQRAIRQRQTLLDKQRMEQELAQAQKMKAIGQLAAGIAHEINTPTQYIGDNTRFLQDAFHDISALLDDYDRLLQAVQKDDVNEELLKEFETRLHRVDLDYLTAEIPQAIRQSLEGVEHVASIVSAMNEFSHPDAVRKQPVDLNHAIEGAITLCRNEWKYLADVVTDFDADLPPVCCLPSDINRVVLNLMVNAAHAIAKASHNGADGKRRITVRTRRDGPCAEIHVDDTGTGIPAEIRDCVFDPFFTTKDVGQGTGQGLAIAHAIVVEKHGGTIHFETEVGRGTCFIVRLPIDGQIGTRPDAVGEEAPVEPQTLQ